MDSFDRQEIKDFDRFSKFLKRFDNISGLKRTKKRDSWDCEFVDNNTGLTWRAELKSRSFPSTHALTKEGLIIEESKLLECTSNFTKPAMYVAMMTDDVIIVYILDLDLAKNSPVVKKVMNKTTIGNNGKIEKEVRLLKPEFGTKFYD